MLTTKDIIREGHETLNLKAQRVKTPVSEEDKKILLDMLGYVLNSQNDELAKKYQLRPAVGIAAPQINVSKRMFAIVVDLGNNDIEILACVNPEIIYRSKEMIYLPDGEGCLSVDRPTTGLTPRHKKIRFKGLLYDFKTNAFKNVNMELDGYLSIVFQHEYDHLEGILFTQKMYKENSDKLKDVKKLEF